MSTQTIIILVPIVALIAVLAARRGDPRVTQIDCSGEEGRGSVKHLFVLPGLALFSTLIALPATAAPNDAQQRYVACVAEMRPAQVRQLLQAVNSEQAKVPYHALADDDRCFSRVYGNKEFRPEDVLSQDMLRGKLAEQALRARETDVKMLQALPLQQKRYVRNWFGATGRHPAVDEMAVCMADTEPVGIAQLINTSPGGRDENDAIAALGPNLTKCLGAGTRLDASRQALRAALADALYQRLSNPPLSMAK